MSIQYKLKGQTNLFELQWEDLINENDENEQNEFKVQKANQRFLEIISSDFDSSKFAKNEFPKQWLTSNIVGQCENLEELQIFLSEFSFYFCGFNEICQAIVKCKYLKQIVISLYRNDINTNLAVQMGEAISQCQLLENIEVSFLRNYILAQGSEEICAQLSKCKLATSISLEFVRIGIEKDDETSIIGDQLSSCKQIRNLKLAVIQNQINSVSVSSCKYLGDLKISIVNVELKYFISQIFSIRQY
ncbi:hypothetical protein ABPG74_022724 [Tetrahymena malaccensis]